MNSGIYAKISRKFYPMLSLMRFHRTASLYA